MVKISDSNMVSLQRTGSTLLPLFKIDLTVSFERVRYATKESFGMAEVKIVVNGIASYPFDVNISGMGVTATGT